MSAVRSTTKVAENLSEVTMQHDFILLQKVTVDDGVMVELPDEFKEFRLRAVAIGPGLMAQAEGGGFEVVPMSVKVGDLVQFAGSAIDIKIGEETFGVVRDNQVLLTVSSATVC